MSPLSEVLFSALFGGMGVTMGLVKAFYPKGATKSSLAGGFLLTGVYMIGVTLWLYLFLGKSAHADPNYAFICTLMTLATCLYLIRRYLRTTE